VIGDIVQPTHLIFILVVALLVLGPKRLPEVGRSLGRGLRDFKNALNFDDDHSSRDVHRTHEPLDAPEDEPHMADAEPSVEHEPAQANTSKAGAASADTAGAGTGTAGAGAPSDRAS
jgi:sec-independent protein translocase protein TatA